MSNNNEIKNPVNAKFGTLVQENVVVVFIDIRDSTKLNDLFNTTPTTLLNIYQNFINKTVKLLLENGFNYYQIQGDGIYGVGWESDMKQNLVKCISDLEEHMENLNQDNIRTTMSIHYGRELYSALGQKQNNKKDFVFFGNIVSKTKKMLSVSLKSTKVIVSKEAMEYLKMYNFDQDNYERIFVFGNNRFNLKEPYVKNWY